MTRRCPVPTAGGRAFERHGLKGDRGKRRIMVKDQPLFALAGLWERWTNLRTGETQETNNIVTTAANPVLAKIHDRMQVIVPPEKY